VRIKDLSEIQGVSRPEQRYVVKQDVLKLRKLCPGLKVGDGCRDNGLECSEHFVDDFGIEARRRDDEAVEATLGGHSACLHELDVAYLPPPYAHNCVTGGA
jgi:hypothetical protein